MIEMYQFIYSIFDILIFNSFIFLYSVPRLQPNMRAAFVIFNL